ncbi:MAG TPA: MaoC family dehydratase N-terminal domain-containing protein [Ktedonobacterales bacterium]|nr:MaoC family dehydratase N-terminal domain-containing protein [Ktedonobacterales bacterium]
MSLDPSLLGHETQPETGAVTAEDVRQFADAIGDAKPLYRDAAAAQAAGYVNIPAPPTFVTRFRVSFEEAGLDVERMQVLHGEQEYTYTRPLYVSDEMSVRNRIASLRQSARGGMAIMTIAQLGDTTAGERIVTGKATVIVREGAPADAASGLGATVAKAARVPVGEPIPDLEKHVTQEQIDAYADVSGDHNPIHVNPEVARAVGLEGTIAHGMLSMAFLGQLLTDWLVNSAPKGSWLARLKVRFQGMVRPGDTLTCHGVLAQSADGKQSANVWIDNQRGERVITGDADLALSSSIQASPPNFP